MWQRILLDKNLQAESSRDKLYSKSHYAPAQASHAWYLYFISNTFHKRTPSNKDLLIDKVRGQEYLGNHPIRELLAVGCFVRKGQHSGCQQLVKPFT
jgi:hypothetical protein